MRWVAVLTGVLCALSACGGSTTSTSASPVIARVGSQVITQQLFDIRLQATMTALKQGGAPTNAGPHDPMVEQLRADVLRGLISDAVIGQEAEYRHVAVTGAQVEAEVAQEQAAAGGAAQLNNQLTQAGGSIDQFKDEIRSQRNDQNLENFFAQQRANAALAALRGGADFAGVASQYSDDAQSAPNGGDVGGVTLATLNASDPVFAQAVEALSVGQLSSAPVRDQAGYEILRLDAHSGTTWNLHRILVSAPQTYTYTNRPSWYSQSLLEALAQLCTQNKVKVLIDSQLQPCSAASPAPTPTATGH